MLGHFSKAQEYVIPQKRKVHKKRPDNFVFRLHYSYTFALLAVCCILVSSQEYIDKAKSNIQCMMDKGVGIKPEIINNYCWIMSTFTLPKYWNGTLHDDGFLHHGVGPYNKEKDEFVYHAYYQWVPLMLAFQAVMFYLPHYIWKALEGRRMERIIAGLNASTGTDEEMTNLVNYLKERKMFKSDSNIWAASFFFCEVLNFVNVVAQIFFTDVFLGGSFLNYGVEVLNWPSIETENRVDPMSRVFPRMTKCIFHKFGGSGTIQKFDAMCVLGMNIINEKVYIILWLWFVVLAIITGFWLIIRLFQLCSPSIRDRQIVLQAYGLRPTGINSSLIKRFLESQSYSEWLILYHLALNMDKGKFGILMQKLTEEMPDEDEFQDESPDGTLKSPASLKNAIPLKKFQRPA